MADFSLEPINSVTQSRVDVPQDAVLEPALGQMPQTVYAPSQQLGTPAFQQAPQIQQTAQLPPGLADAYQQAANYQSFGEKHPILGSFFGYETPKDKANLEGLQRKISSLSAIQSAQQAAGTNATHRGAYNALAQNNGLPQADPNAVLGKEDLTLGKELAQTYGSPALMGARDKYNQDLSEYNAAMANRRSYDARARAGLLSPQDKGFGPPSIPEKPVFSADSINPYLEAGKVSGVTGTSNEAAKTGIDSTEEAGKQANDIHETNIKHEEAVARLAELQNQLRFQEQTHQDSIGLQKAQMSQQEQQFQTKQAEDVKTHNTLAMEHTHNRLATDANNATLAAARADHEVSTLSQKLATLVSKTPKSSLATSPAYRGLYSDWVAAKQKADSLTNQAHQKQQSLATFAQHIDQSQPQEAQLIDSPKPVKLDTAPNIKTAKFSKGMKLNFSDAQLQILKQKGILK